MTQFHVLGIRHHGPGSARNVVAALEALQPDCILIELPEQCTPRMLDLARPGFEPPIALLLYNEKDLQEAAFYPFAAYSPEWQAILYAVKQKTEVRAIDLPFLFAPSANFPSAVNALAPVTDAQTPDAVVMRDPFLAIAQLDGFSDAERWWETRIERQEAEVLATFQTIADLMAALREGKTTPESNETLLREAHMRQGMRQAEKDGFQRVVVVCGAWHVPMLKLAKPFSPTTDAAVLKGKRKVKVETTWIPWSFEHLSIQRGYMAGVVPKLA
jgi:pheromone shutdown protein TraB